jgi:hypothetical protein
MQVNKIYYFRKAYKVSCKTSRTRIALDTYYFINNSLLILLKLLDSICIKIT